jgi:hypothetical protein
MTAAFSPELMFVCACCGWPDHAERRARIAEFAGGVADWDEVARLAQVHRVEGLVAQGARVAGPGDRFSATADRVKRQALEDLAETIRVTRALDSAGVRNAVLKGVPVGIRAFGTPTLKQSWDVDVLVAPSDAVAAARIISELGYRPRIPARPLTEAEFRRWSPVSKEAVFDAPTGRTVELHWGLSDHPMLLRGVAIEAAGEPVELLDGAVVMTLSDAANLAYLAVHGASHGWCRLKWLADFAGFLAAQPVDARVAMIEDARACGTGFALDQALLLSRQLLASAVPAPRPSAEAERLSGLAMVAIERRGQSDDLERDAEAKSAIREIRWGLVPGRRYRLILALQTLRGSEDRRLMALPPALGWIYWVIRPFSGLFRSVLRQAHR